MKPFPRRGWRSAEAQQLCTFAVCVIDFGQEVGPAAVSQCGNRTLQLPSNSYFR